MGGTDMETIAYILLYLVILFSALSLAGAIVEYGPRFARKWRRAMKKRRIKAAHRAAARFSGNGKGLCTRRRKLCRDLERTSR